MKFQPGLSITTKKINGEKKEQLPHHNNSRYTGLKNKEEEMSAEAEQRFADDRNWLLATFYVAESGSVSKAEVYEAYARYCMQGRKDRATQAVFGRMIVTKAFPLLKTSRHGKRGQVQYHYHLLQFIRLEERPTGPYLTKECKENNTGLEEGSATTTKRKGKTKKTPSSSDAGGKKRVERALSSGDRQDADKKVRKRKRSSTKEGGSSTAKRRVAYTYNEDVKIEDDQTLPRSFNDSQWPSCVTKTEETNVEPTYSLRPTTICPFPADNAEEEEEEEMRVTRFCDEGLQNSWNDPWASSSFSSLLASFNQHATREAQLNPGPSTTTTSTTTTSTTRTTSTTKEVQEEEETGGGATLCSGTAMGPFYLQSLYAMADAHDQKANERHSLTKRDSLEPFAVFVPSRVAPSESSCKEKGRETEYLAIPPTSFLSAPKVGLEDYLVGLRVHQRRRDLEQPKDTWKTFDFNPVLSMLDTHSALTDSSTSSQEWGR